MEYPKRKNIRLNNYDYSQTGAYFITICAQNKQNLFGNIVGDGFPVPFTDLNAAGKIVSRFANEISIKYVYVTNPKYVIMPNHVHFILFISNPDSGTGNPSPTVGTVVGWFKYQTTKYINVSNNTPGEKIWQRSYYDHIIRNETEYQKIWQYVDENPAKWAEDRYYEK